MATNVIKLKDKETGDEFYPMTTTSAVVDSNGNPMKYAGSSSVNGSAISSDKLSSVRNVNGISFDGTADIVHYGQCTTEINVSDKIVSLSNYVLTVGSKVCVNFINGNNASSPTLNINGTGSKSISRYGRIITDSRQCRFGSNEVVEFVYNGSTYEIINMSSLSDWYYI